MVEFKQLHSWNLSPSQAIKLQRELSQKIIKRDELGKVNIIAGVDIAIEGNEGICAIVFLEHPTLRKVDEVFAKYKIRFPYIPGLLSFREAPVILEAFREARLIPDLIFFDGQGILHPRRFGIASHIGLILDLPSIGCAKSLLCGCYDEPGLNKGSFTHINDRNEIIGIALRTKDNTKEIYVSIGHKISLETALKHSLATTRNYRIPEPTRLAHIRAGHFKKKESNGSENIQTRLF